MKAMSLTLRHIARIHRAVPDGGVPHGLELHSDADYEHWVDLILRARPEPAAPLRRHGLCNLNVTGHERG